MRWSLSSAMLVAIVLPLAACKVASTPSSAPPAQGAPAAASTAAPAPAAASPAPEAVTVRWGGQGVLTDSPVYVAMDRGYFGAEGIDLQYVNFSSASEIVPAVSNNQLEVGAISPNVATLNALARGVGVKLVADRGSMRPGHGWVALVVRPDLVESGRYQSPADLRGLRVAVTPPVGATANAVAVARLLDQQGIAPSEVDFVPLPFPEMNPALANGSIDVAFQSEPLLALGIRQGIAVREVGSDEIYPNQQIGVVSYGADFVQDQPDIARRFMVAYLRGARDFVDAFAKGRDRAEVVQSLIRHTPVKDASVYDEMVATGFNPDGYINVDSVASDQEWFLAQGKIAERVDLATAIDNQYVDYALGRLGRYQP